MSASQAAPSGSTQGLSNATSIPKMSIHNLLNDDGSRPPAPTFTRWQQLPSFISPAMPPLASFPKVCAMEMTRQPTSQMTTIPHLAQAVAFPSRRPSPMQFVTPSPLPSQTLSPLHRGQTEKREIHIQSHMQNLPSHTQFALQQQPSKQIQNYYQTSCKPQKSISNGSDKSVSPPASTLGPPKSLDKFVLKDGLLVGKYACTMLGCSKRFKRKHHLESHLVSHSPDKPFGCEYDGCGASFRRPQELKRHKRITNH